MADFPVVDLTTDELLTTTRTVRKRLDLTREVPLDLVKQCLTIALQAPSGSNAQGWQWIVVTDSDLRARLGDIYRECFADYITSSYSAANIPTDNPDRAAVQKRVSDSATWLGDHMGEVPVLLVACIRAGRELPPGNQSALWGSLLPAVWSYSLAARARGLGTAWTTVHLQREQEVAELLGIPEGYHQGVLMPTAYYTGETFKPAPREPIETVLHMDRW